MLRNSAFCSRWPLFSIIGLKEDIDVPLAAAELAISLLGNYIGGGLLIGLYYAYLNDATAYLQSTRSTTGTGSERA